MGLIRKTLALGAVVATGGVAAPIKGSSRKQRASREQIRQQAIANTLTAAALDGHPLTLTEAEALVDRAHPRLWLT